mmetsp:Transcript_23792/g.46739  ORF Transcript_23792/g.46739 Transcript_23792/m.46739 type:complete len:107 (-) Transcript_23792:134-454(-)
MDGPSPLPCSCMHACTHHITSWFRLVRKERKEERKNGGFTHPSTLRVFALLADCYQTGGWKEEKRPFDLWVGLHAVAGARRQKREKYGATQQPPPNPLASSPVDKT